jgi:hypothetical protein
VPYRFLSFSYSPHIIPSSSVRDSSKILIQVFDQRKFKKNDQGCLGSVSITVGDVLTSTQGGDGIVLSSFSPLPPSILLTPTSLTTF